MKKIAKEVHGNWYPVLVSLQIPRPSLYYFLTISLLGGKAWEQQPYFEPGILLTTRVTSPAPSPTHVVFARLATTGCSGILSRISVSVYCVCFFVVCSSVHLFFA